MRRLPAAYAPALDAVQREPRTPAGAVWHLCLVARTQRTRGRRAEAVQLHVGETVAEQRARARLVPLLLHRVPPGQQPDARAQRASTTDAPARAVLQAAGPLSARHLLLRRRPQR